MKLTFLYNTRSEEGQISKTDSQLLLDHDWVIAADFLKDVIYDATALYDQVLEKKGKGGQ